MSGAGAGWETRPFLVPLDVIGAPGQQTTSPRLFGARFRLPRSAPKRILRATEGQFRVRLPRAKFVP